MTPEQFTYWLQGFMEILDPTMIHEKETQIIKDHLKTVFNKVTPEYINTPTIGVKDFTEPYEIDWQYRPNQIIC
jgi:hypothetical protein